MKNITNIERMQRPVKPIEPDCTDKKKYPDSERPNVKNYLGATIKGTHPGFVADYTKYQKDLGKYNIDIKLWEQIQLIKKIKHTSLKTCIEKYHITKIK